MSRIDREMRKEYIWACGTGAEGSMRGTEGMLDCWEKSVNKMLTASLARPPGGRRDRTGQLSIGCPQAVEGWSHVSIVYVSLESPGVARIPSMRGRKKETIVTGPMKTWCEDPTDIPASSSPPSSTRAPARGTSTPPSVSVVTPATVNARVPPRLVCPPKSNGSEGCES